MSQEHGRGACVVCTRPSTNAGYPSETLTIDQARSKDSYAFTVRQENPFGPSTKRQAYLPNRLNGRKPVRVGDNEPAVAPEGTFFRAYACKQGARHVEKDCRTRLGIVHEADELRGSTDATFQDANHSYRAPCKGTVFQRVRTPPGNYRSSRKQSELWHREEQLKPSM